MKARSDLRLLLAITAAFGAPGLFAPANAQEPAAGESEEIIVTAQRRAERLQDLPLAVSAFSGQMLEKMSAERVSDVIAFVPNVAFTAGPSGGDDANIFIRGVGQVDNSVAVDPGVGVYIDEVYIGRLQSSALDLLDIQRVEVLRGPQGTLFGRNTIGGAVNVVTRDPGDEFEGNLRIVAGSRDRLDVRGGVSGPLSDTLSASIALASRNQQGWGKNFYNDATYGDVEDLGGRLKLVYKPTSDVTAKLSVDYTKSDGSPSSQVLLGVNRGAGCRVDPPPTVTPGGIVDPPPFFIPNASPLCVPFPAGIEGEITNDPEANFSSARPISESENRGAALTLEWVHDWGVIKSITAARAYEEFVFNDFDGTSFPIYDNRSELDQEQYSQELQAYGDAFGDRLNWLVGLYGYKEDITSEVGLCIGGSTRFSNACLLTDNFLGVDVTSLAAFGQARYALTDKLKLIAGLRWTQEEKEQTFSSAFVRPAPPTVISLSPFPPVGRTVVLPYSGVSDTFESTTPKFGVEYELSDDLLLYLTYAEGFKSGGFTGRPSRATISSYDPEQVKTYEFGWKADFLDRRLRVNGAVFTSDYTDLQLLVADQLTGQFDTVNAGDAEISGAEVEIAARPVDGLNLYANVGYLDASYKSVSPRLTGVSLDDELPLTPEWTASVGAAYRWSLGDLGAVEVRADYAWRDEVFFQIENDPLEGQDAYGLLNLRATYDTPGGASLSVYGVNVTDETYLTGANQANGVAFGGYGAPAEYVVELQLRF